MALDVLVVCTLVAGLAASLGLLQREALRSALGGTPVTETVLTVTSPYDESDPAGQDAAMREALAPVTSVAGGDVVTVVESGTYDLRGEPRGLSFAAVTGAGQRLALEAGRLPGAGPGPVEVAAPVGAGLDLGAKLTPVNRADGRETTVVVVGHWDLPRGQERALADLEATSLLVAPDRFAGLSGAGTSAHWRAVPALSDLGPPDLAPLSAAVSGAVTEVRAVAEARGTSVQSESGLVAALDDRARELRTLRALLLVPAGMLVLVAAAGLLLVAAGLADVRRDEESLLRSRGAGHRQLVGPTLIETVLVCGAAAAVAPLLATLLVRVDDVRPPLSGSGWVASVSAAGTCAVALCLPAAVRSVRGDRGHAHDAERHRRRTLTTLATGLLLVTALGVLAVVELRGFGAAVMSATTTTDLDRLLVASPALLLLCVAAVAAVLAVPPALRVVARMLSGRGVAPVLGSRFAARTPSRAVPLALAVTLATGTLAFAAIERSSSGEARVDRASYVVGADVRVSAPPPALREGTLTERTTLDVLPGVEHVTAVHRGGTFLHDLPTEVVVGDLAGRPEDLLEPGSTEKGEPAVRPLWDEVGVALPDGTGSLEVDLAGDGPEATGVVLVGPDGELTVVPGAVGGRPIVADVAGLPDGTRVAAVVTAASTPPGGPPDVSVRADGVALGAPGTWWAPDETAVVVLAGSAPAAPEPIPAVLTEDLAREASLEVGDTLSVSALGVPTGIEVAATVPSVRTVADGRGGILLDSGTALPVLLAGGLSEGPTEWWLGVRGGAGDEVVDALREEPGVASIVRTRADELARLDVDPGTGGAALAQVLLLTGGGCLVIGILLLFSIVLLHRRERAEQARMLGAAGGDRRLLSGVLAWQYAVVTGIGLAVGLAAGAFVAAMTLTSMTLGPGGLPLRPPPGLDLPLLSLLVPSLAMLAVPLAVQVWLVRREHPRGLGLPDRQGAPR